MSKTQIVEKKRERTRADIAREIRIKEAEKAKQYRELAKQERKRLLQQFDADHKFQRSEPYFLIPYIMKRKPKNSSTIEKVVVLVDSIYAQSQYNIGKIALTTISKILKNTALVREKGLV